MKHFIDIENLREEDIDLGNGAIRRSNCGAFKPGVNIHVSCKVDGSNGSFRYNEETGKLDVFSRKRELDHINTLDGFWNFIQTYPWDMEELAQQPNWIYYGEWIPRAHIVQYPQEMYKQWYVYDIWDTELERYLPAKFVEAFAKNNNLNYIETFYEGPFISWDHVRSFCHSSKYGEHQEGVVCRLSGSDAYNNYDVHNPPFLKIVNDEYKETSIKQHQRKLEDPQKLQEKERCKELCESIVTEQRVHKELHKMIDEGIIPKELSPQIMSTVAKILPKRIYDDCMKEESEIVIEAGEFAGKTISGLTMNLAKKIIIGG